MNASKSFSIGLPYQQDGKYDITKLLSDIANELQNVNQEGAIRVSDLYLKMPYTSDSGPRIAVEYEYLNADELKDSNKSLTPNLTGQLSVSHSTSKSDISGLDSVTFGLPKEDASASSVDLIERISKAGDLRDQNVIDLIYHEYLDDDGIERPFVRAYIKR